ncbi:cell division protein FtsQ [Mumia flava]|uniref:Cell division protein FtsQ n=1 Tax=Mumia flava TaxID=1348852 RepID=A0A2M9BDK7_9ACTN|nr:FtsQ-type POTRA domain-containing protein [Mumia flava]PJJ56022.1 cell division protein FtsQ [Mumia flava]
MTTTTDRFAARRWRARLVRARPWLLALLGLGLVAVAVWVVAGTSVLGVDDVEVDGNRTVDAQVVVDAAEVVTGTPLVRLDTDAIRERVATVPQVASVEVRRRLPGTVVVTVVERTPVAEVTIAGETLLLADDGVVYPPAGRVPGRLPAVEVADRVRDRDAALSEVAAAISAMEESVARRVSEVQVRSRDGITLSLRDGAVVEWGSADQPELKAEVLGVLLAQKAARYDVSTPGRPTIVP